MLDQSQWTWCLQANNLHKCVYKLMGEYKYLDKLDKLHLEEISYKFLQWQLKKQKLKTTCRSITRELLSIIK